MDKQLKTIIVIAISVITFSVFYYFVIFLPLEQKEIRIKQETGISDILVCRK
jgi:type II secretory pathway component PulM